MKNLALTIISLLTLTGAFAQNNETYQFDVAKSGMYWEGTAGIALTEVQYEYTEYTYDYNTGQSTETGRTQYQNDIPGATFGYRFGNKFYFGAKDDQQFGLNVIWMKQSHGIVANDLYVSFSPLNVGISSIWRKSSNIAIEANLNGGYELSAFSHSKHQIKINPEVKIRIGRTHIGLGYELSTPLHYANSEYSNYRAMKHLTHKAVFTIGLGQA